ncbi:hypothetical protein Poli38472_011405 [Pythium oligandrum]|uniref:Uncharacterized protein n=1 Tax=Pythium oligandrum TaxID=41045 RepID=A0A8K1CJQ5_PYTOL|nr:hypothetical protein Poli38472_011405 [Pythium oligandrum]|eukprot:TMW64525.1 hypothetical protein Poli38472_011405 [Pythium oligandrum]
MGNSLFTCACRRDEAPVFDDISDATFEFITVAVNTDDVEKPRRRRARAAVPSTPTTRVVAVLPVSVDAPSALTPTSALRLYEKKSSGSTTEDDEMSFNDRLNMLTWDPERLPSSTKRHDVYVFDECASSPCNSTASTPTKTARTKPSGWFQRGKSKSDDEPKKTKKRSRRTSLWSKSRSSESTPYQLPQIDDGALTEDDEQEHFLQTSESWKMREEEDTQLSETESEVSATTPVFVTGFDAKLLTNYECDENETEIEWSTTSSVYFSASDDSSEANEDAAVDNIDEILEFFVSSDALCVPIDDYLSECGGSLVYQHIERAVTSSNCWMNEAERRSLYRILQAYASLNPTVRFQTEMISAAEECLVVFPGDEDAAFNAFVMLSQTKWTA